MRAEGLGEIQCKVRSNMQLHTMDTTDIMGAHLAGRHFG